jgi:predicted ribosome quality control (RQC) complex YloA/Tae2 family protein
MSNSPVDITEELIEKTLKDLGKTRAEFEQRVEAAKPNTSTEIIGNLLTVVMQSMDTTATMLSLLMQKQMELQNEIDTLKGGNTNG